MVAGVAIIALAVAVSTRSQIQGAQFGVALLNLVTLGENVGTLITSWAQMETSIAAVARIQDFSSMTPREISLSENTKSSIGKQEHLSTGVLSIDVSNVTVKLA